MGLNIHGTFFKNTDAWITREECDTYKCAATLLRTRIKAHTQTSNCNSYGQTHGRNNFLTYKSTQSNRDLLVQFSCKITTVPYINTEQWHNSTEKNLKFRIFK